MTDRPAITSIDGMTRHDRPRDEARSLRVLRDVAVTGWAETLRMSVLVLVHRHPVACIHAVALLLAMSKLEALL